jgi:hypothetical protein
MILLDLSIQDLGLLVLRHDGPAQWSVRREPGEIVISLGVIQLIITRRQRPPHGVIPDDSTKWRCPAATA